MRLPLGEFGVIACLMGVAFVFAAALHHAHRASHAPMQDAEWVRQLNMAFGETSSAAWEIDFERSRSDRWRKLAAVLGRPVTYADVVEQRLLRRGRRPRALVKDRVLAGTRADAPDRARVHDVAATARACACATRAWCARRPMGRRCVYRPASRSAWKQPLFKPASSLGDAADDAAAALVAQTETLKTLEQRTGDAAGGARRCRAAVRRYRCRSRRDLAHAGAAPGHDRKRRR